MKFLIVLLFSLNAFAGINTNPGLLAIGQGGTNNGALSVAGGVIPYGDGTKLVGLANGTLGHVLQSAGGTAAPLWAAVLPTIHVEDQKVAGTAGGSSVAGNQVRTLNTSITNTIAGASLAANQVTLPAGTYLAVASAPNYAGNQHRMRLVNATDAANVLLGGSEYSDAVGSASTNSELSGVFTLGGAKALQLTHFITRAQATNGLGVPVGDTFVEVYARLVISRLF